MNKDDLEKSKLAVQKIKDDIVRMKSETKPEDVIPAAVMFMLMDAMIPVMEGMIKQIENKEN